MMMIVAYKVDAVNLVNNRQSSILHRVPNKETTKGEWKPIEK